MVDGRLIGDRKDLLSAYRRPRSGLYLAVAGCDRGGSTEALTATTRLAADADDAPEEVEVIAPLDRWIGRYADVAMAWR